MLSLPADRLQQIVLCNASDQPFADYVEYQPWLDLRIPWAPSWRLLDEKGQAIRYQQVQPEALVADNLVAGVVFHMELKPGEMLSMEGGPQELQGGPQEIRLLGRLGEGTWRAEPVPAGPAVEILGKYGSAPLPPYIHRGQAGEDNTTALDELSREVDLQRYQTVFARQPGAVAAPTAGLHFTPEMLEHIDAAGMGRIFVTLHVGVGTFSPIRVDDLPQHVMHSEWYECSAATAEAVNTARREGRPIVAVGTTSVRVLETCATEQGQVRPGSGWTNIFIYPPYRYRVVDALITNFHLPESTLLALVFAFAGRERVLHAYEQAVAERYRFFSYGDAMLIR
jgi:S-adenosylmethionine:tRNA-ribosyltransferase-isomerase (queuine synthetase)